MIAGGRTATPQRIKRPDEIAGFFEGLEVLDPGVVSISLWRPDAAGPEPVGGHGAVARKP